MFSGIIRHTGILEKVSSSDQGMEVIIESALFGHESRIGDSISVNGVCLTITDMDKAELGKIKARFFIGSETLRTTSFNLYGKEDKSKKEVHLERSITLNETLDGHIVYGHVDGVVSIEEKSLEGETWRVLLKTDSASYPFLSPKGSVSLNGVSLTIGESYVKDNFAFFSVYIIPHTYEVTCFSEYKTGEVLNLEYDPLSRYAVHAAKVLSEHN